MYMTRSVPLISCWSVTKEVVMHKSITILFGLFLGFAYLGSLAFYLSYSGLVKDIPAPMSFFIFSLVPLSFFALPMVILSAGIVLYEIVDRLRKKEPVMTRRFYLFLSYLVLSLGFFVFVIGMNNWKLIPVKL